MLLTDLVSVSGQVAATRSRTAKIRALAALLEHSEPGELAAAIAYLSGELPQGRIGVGYALVYGLEVAASPEPSLQLSDLASTFDSVQGTSGPGSQARRRQLLTDLLARATLEEQVFVKRLLVGELRQGALAGLMADAIAEAAGLDAALVRRAAMLSGDLAGVGEKALSGGAKALSEYQLQLFTALQPMLAKTAADTAAALDKIPDASVEWKLDGARVQVHRQGEEIKVFTRNLRDVTASSPDIVSIAAQLPVDQVILDGEAVGFDRDGKPLAFQDTIGSFSAEDGATGLSAMFFDVLHLDGQDLIDRPLAERHDFLDRAVPERWRVPRLVTAHPDEAEAFNRAALAAGQEGVMVKDRTSIYNAGRRGAGWLKVKPVHTLDLVVVAVEWGSGRRKGWLSNIHLAAREAETGEFVMLGKTFKGMTDEILAWQTERFLELEDHRDGRTVYLRPEQVVEIAFDGVQRSTRYPGGVALRFARVKGYRDDKPAGEADSLATVRSYLR